MRDRRKCTTIVEQITNIKQIYKSSANNKHKTNIGVEQITNKQKIRVEQITNIENIRLDQITKKKYMGRAN